MWCNGLIFVLRILTRGARERALGCCVQAVSACGRGGVLHGSGVRLSSSS